MDPYHKNILLASVVSDSMGITQYTFNTVNQLVGIQKDGLTATYSYLPDGMRNEKTVNGVTTGHLWDGTNMVAETSGDAVVYKYVRGAGLLYTENATDEKTWYVKDAHGDTVQLTDGNGNIVRNYAYDAFGNQKETVNSDTEPYNPFRYTGEYFDAETGFIYLRARYMDPQIGRFISEDPVGDGVNWYVYAAGNPVRYYDPSGLAVTAWDEQHLTKSEQKALEQYTKDWNDANKAGDEYGMYRAHANAEDIRRKYRDLNEITLDNGLTGTVSLDKDYSRIFTYVERREKEKQQYSFTEQMAMIVLFPFTALTSCERQQSYEEWVQEARLAGNKVNTGYGFNDYSIKFATSAYNHMQNANRYVPIPILIDVIQTGIPGADPQGSSATMYYSVIERNNTMYNIEVLYNENTNTIYHFKYSSDAMGPLPAINRKGK